jgi:hypothetical protein
MSTALDTCLIACRAFEENSLSLSPNERFCLTVFVAGVGADADADADKTVLVGMLRQDSLPRNLPYLAPHLSPPHSTTDSREP